MSCLYCKDEYSSKIADENRKFGKFNDNGVVLENKEKHYKSLVPLFWQWLNSNYLNLKELNVLGGEALLQKELYTLLDFFEENPNPNCAFSIVSNLNIPTESLKNFVEKTKKLVRSRKLKSLDITASIDCWGEQQEYVRYGLNLKTWEENFNYLLSEKWIKLKINQTISLLTIKTMPSLIEKIIEWKNIRKFGHYFGYVQDPTYMSAHILGPHIFKEDFQKVIALMPSNSEEEKNAISYMSGIADTISNSSVNYTEISKLFTFLDEKDRRRGTNWRKLFPWLIDFQIDITNKI
jgi:hypothetical protein